MLLHLFQLECGGDAHTLFDVLALESAARQHDEGFGELGRRAAGERDILGFIEMAMQDLALLRENARSTHLKCCMP